MIDAQPPFSTGALVQDPAERLVQHLLSQPHDLIDARRLMQRFHVSAADFKRALALMEQRDAAETKETSVP